MVLPRVRFVFTPAGFALLVAALIILIRALSVRNSYEILLASAVLLLMLILGILGVLKSRRFKTLEIAWKFPFPFTANAGEETVVTGIGIPVPRFFRLHLIIKGRFFPSGSSGACPVFAENSVPRGDSTGRFNLAFPMSGVFQGIGFCRIRDIFGFFSFPCGIPQQKTVKVRSAPCFKTNFPINAQSGAEDRRSKNTSDEERYYMREYSPGDRSRDINWKSSERIDTLITRISPENREKVNRIVIFFRNYGSVGKSSLEDLWFLDRAKARLSRFLRSLKEEQPSYIFHIRSAQSSWEIEDQDDLEAFLEELAGLSFAPHKNESPDAEETLGEVFIFSTACDIGLPGFLLACQSRPVSLFFVRSPMPDKKMADEKEMADIEVLRIRDFPAKGCIPFLRWFLPGKPGRLNVCGDSGSRIEISYAETRW